MTPDILARIESLAKSQKVRLFDIYALGPFLIYAALAKKPGRWTRRMLLTSGIMTIAYNLGNYMNIKKELAERMAEYV